MQWLDRRYTELSLLRMRRAAPTRSCSRTPWASASRASGTGLLELALNMKSPTNYDITMNGDREERVVNQEASFTRSVTSARFRSY